jgi:hypothetical protein
MSWLLVGEPPKGGPLQFEKEVESNSDWRTAQPSPTTALQYHSRPPKRHGRASSIENRTTGPSSSRAISCATRVRIGRLDHGLEAREQEIAFLQRMMAKKDGRATLTVSKGTPQRRSPVADSIENWTGRTGSPSSSRSSHRRPPKAPGEAVNLKFGLEARQEQGVARERRVRFGSFSDRCDGVGLQIKKGSGEQMVEEAMKTLALRRRSKAK